MSKTRLEALEELFVNDCRRIARSGPLRLTEAEGFALYIVSHETERLEDGWRRITSYHGQGPAALACLGRGGFVYHHPDKPDLFKMSIAG